MVSTWDTNQDGLQCLTVAIQLNMANEGWLLTGLCDNYSRGSKILAECQCVTLHAALWT